MSEPGNNSFQAQGLARLFEGRDIAGLVFIRIGLGLVMIYEGVFRIVSGELEAFYTSSLFRFSYPGFGWVPVLRDEVGVGLCLLMSLLGVFFVLGLIHRVAGAVYLVIAAYFLVYDRAIYINHFYLMWLMVLLLSLMPANRDWSIDAWRKSEFRSRLAPLWCWWVLRYQVGLVYFFAGLVKLRPDWLQARPAVYMWQSAAERIGALQALPPEAMAYLLAYGGLAVDLFAVPVLLWRRTRLAMFTVITLFHIGNAILFSGTSFRLVGAFPWLMLVVTTAYFEPDWPRRLAARLGIKAPGGESTSGAPVEGPQQAPFTPTGLRKAGIVCFAAYVVIQLALPLRFLAYPGNTLWTGEGAHYAWQMMSHHRFGAAKFQIVHPESGEHWTILPGTTLTPDQTVALAGNPSLMQEYARHLAARFERAGYPGCEVRVETLASLNGRPFQRFIDPAVDLVTAEAPWGHYPWVLPVEHELPPLEQALHPSMEDLAPLRRFKEG